MHDDPNDEITAADGSRRHRRRPLGRLAGLAGAATLAAVLTAGVAAAWWTTSGSGTGSVTATSAQHLTSSAATTTAALYPGITGADLSLTVNNPNPFPVAISSVNADGAATADGDHPSCVTTGVTFSSTAVDQTVPANGSVSFSASGVSMSNDSDNGCQGATFTIPVSFTATSA